MVKAFPTLKTEKLFWADGHSVIGVDEVGRGCLAGPVVAGAVCIEPDHRRIRGITDSKLLTPNQRKTFSQRIKERCQTFAIGVASVEEINSLGIVPATFLAMERAILQLKKVEVLLVDGSLTPRFNSLSPLSINTLIKGDRLSYSIAAASILAKVYRDELMETLHEEFPTFIWNKNKGYGTKEHKAAILKHGLTEHHRRLFCQKILTLAGTL